MLGVLHERSGLNVSINPDMAKEYKEICANYDLTEIEYTTLTLPDIPLTSEPFPALEVRLYMFLPVRRYLQQTACSLHGYSM